MENHTVSTVTETPKEIFLRSHPWEVVKLHFLPIMGTIVLNFLWILLNPILKSPIEDISSYQNIFLMPVAIYLAISGYTINKLLKEKNIIKKAWRRNSRVLFEEYVDERIPGITHGILIVLSSIIMFLIFTCPLNNYTGHIFTSTSSLVIMYGWAWAKELNNHFDGIYKLDIDILEERWPGVCNGYKRC